MAELEQGSKAPPFALMDQDGKKVRLSDFKEKKLLVFFYPKAGTSGCTRQACSVSTSLKDLKKLGVAAVGISPDLSDKQMKFDLRYISPFVGSGQQGCQGLRSLGPKVDVRKEI